MMGGAEQYPHPPRCNSIERSEKTMAWNPSPKVAAARDIGKRFGKPIVVVLMVDDNGIEYASYGQDKKLCDLAKQLADIALNAVEKRWLDEGKNESTVSKIWGKWPGEESVEQLLTALKNEG